MGKLSRRISPLTLFLLSINAIIGSGWLFAPLYAAKIAGPAAVFSWSIAGIAAAIIALTFAELSTMFPVAGGSAHIPQMSHGIFVSFILSWVAWITALMLAPIEVQAVLQYAALLFPSLMGNQGGVPHLTWLGYCWAALLMLALCMINIVSYRGLMRFNFLLCFFKFAIILLTIFALCHIRFNTGNFSGMWQTLGTSAGWQSIFSAVATAGIVLAFNGFKSGVELAGEAKNLALAIPLSTAGSVIACMILYVLLQICFIGALEPGSLTHGWSQLNFAGDLGPFVGLAAALGLFWLLKLLYANAVISPLGAGLIYVTATARILYAMSRIGFMPKILSKVNQQGFPVWAILVNFIIGMLSFLPLPGWQAMVNFLVSAMIITYAMGPIAVMTLRHSLPEKERPFRLPAANIVCFIAFYLCNLFSYWTGWQTMSKLALIILLGLVVFSLAFWRKAFPISKTEIRAGLWMLPYLGGLTLISYLGAFGGLNVIPFGYDFLVIGVFSSSILYLALHSGLNITSQEVSDFLLAEDVGS